MTSGVLVVPTKYCVTPRTSTVSWNTTRNAEIETTTTSPIRSNMTSGLLQETHFRIAMSLLLN
ncbi:MAG: hypothetical protein C4K47_10465 [Candidatus Thorarchaeota archaeon]|nr:MAG: hypothetical protein C4K47_10465 [Candidatus Thorarchaeota archaeon]